MSLDWSLDEIIQANRKASNMKQNAEKEKRRGTSSPYKLMRRTDRDEHKRRSPDLPPLPKIPGNIEGKWEHDLYAYKSPGKEREVRRSKTTTLRIEKMPLDLCEPDFKEMGEQFGCIDIRPHMDRDGFFIGTVDLAYESKGQAFATLRKYENIKMDGKHLQLKVLDGDEPKPFSTRITIENPSVMSRLSYPAAHKPKFSLRKDYKPRDDKTERRREYHFLDRLADDEDFQKEEKEKRELRQLDADLDAYMNRPTATKKNEGAA